MELVFGNLNEMHALVSPSSGKNSQKARFYGANSFPLFFPLESGSFKLTREGRYYSAFFCLSSDEPSVFDGLSDILVKRVAREKDFFDGFEFVPTKPHGAGIGFLADKYHTPRISIVASSAESEERPNILIPAREIHLGGHGSVEPRFDKMDAIDFCLDLRRFGRLVNIYLWGIVRNYAKENPDYVIPRRVRIQAVTHFAGTYSLS